MQVVAMLSTISLSGAKSGPSDTMYPPDWQCEKTFPKEDFLYFEVASEFKADKLSKSRHLDGTFKAGYRQRGTHWNDKETLDGQPPGAFVVAVPYKRLDYTFGAKRPGLKKFMEKIQRNLDPTWKPYKK